MPPITDTVIIRPVVRDDLAGLLGLYRQLNPADHLLDSQVADTVFSRLLESDFHTVFVAEESGILVASCALSIIPNLTRGARSYGVIENVVTHDQHRRRGLGRSVMAAALNMAWDAGCYKVRLSSGRDENTLRFYDKIGFKRSGKTFFEMRP